VDKSELLLLVELDESDESELLSELGSELEGVDASLEEEEPEDDEFYWVSVSLFVQFFTNAVLR